MASLLDQLERALYEGVLARDEFHVTTFTMANAWKFFMECAEKNKKVRECVLDIEVKGSGYKISQLMLDEGGMPVNSDPEHYVGRIVKAKALDDDVIDFMKGEHRQKMKMPY